MDKKEIYTYEAPWTIYGMSWSVRPDKPFRLALGSFIEDYSNKVELVQLDEEKGDFVSCGGFSHPYPPTKIMFNPETNTQSRDLIATTGDYLRLWQVKDSQTISPLAVFNNNKNSEFCAPITSFDWSESDPKFLGNSSIDTTCTIWDIEKQVALTQLIAHDKEVFDMAFMRNRSNIFVSVGADGSARMFDLRALEHCTIIYENQDMTPLLRVAWNRLDTNYLATFSMESNQVIILDIRLPSVPVAELSGHRASVNAIAWAPILAGDDSQALIWALNQIPKPIEEPLLAYTAEKEINQLQWSISQPDWVAIAYANRMQILRV